MYFESDDARYTAVGAMSSGCPCGRGFFSAYGGDHLEDVTRDLGREWDITTNMAIKLVPGGHPHHAAAEAAANAAIAGNVNPGDVARITVSAAKIPHSAWTQAPHGPDRPRTQPRLLHRGRGGRQGLRLGPRLGEGRRPGDRAAHRQAHRGPEPAAVPGPVASTTTAPPSRSRSGTVASFRATSISREDRDPAGSHGPTWTRSTGPWCRSPGWRRKSSRPASKSCTSSRRSRPSRSSPAC